MPAFTLRSVKNAPLTNDEVDGTFQYLKDEVDVLKTKSFGSSAQLRLLLSDPTGSGKAVFATSPVFLNGIYSTSLVFALFNDTVTTINFAGAATVLNIGAAGCATTIQGNVAVTGDVVSAASSDISLKENVQVIENALESLLAIEGVTWDWKEGVNEIVKLAPTTGVIAQDVEKVQPRLVTEDADGIKRVHYANMVGVIIEAIRTLNARIDRLEKE